MTGLATTTTDTARPTAWSRWLAGLALAGAALLWLSFGRRTPA